MTREHEIDTAARARLLESTWRWSALSDVADALSVVTTMPGSIYVERRGSEYRWSFAHRGGPYPLLRIAAAFLGVDHRKILIGFETVDGWTVLRQTPEEEDRPDRWTVIQIDAPRSAESLTTELPALLCASDSG